MWLYYFFLLLFILDLNAASFDVFIKHPESSPEKHRWVVIYRLGWRIGWSCRDAGTVSISFLMRDLWLMTTRPACMDVLYLQRLYGELAVNPRTCISDYIHVGELRFMVTKEASVQDGVAVERQGPPHLLSASPLNAWAKNHAAKGPFRVRLLLCHVCGCSAISAFILPLSTSLLLQDVFALIYLCI